MNGSALRLLLACAVVLAAAVLLWLRLTGLFSVEQVAGLLDTHRHAAKYAMFFLYLLSPLLLLPTVYLTFVAGILWGPFWGVLVDLTGATLGSTLAFVVSRYVARDWVARKIGKDRIASYLARERTGWKLNAFLRLNPVFPSAMIGYFFGLTSTPLVEFSLSTFLSLIPACVVVVLLGSSFGHVLTGSGSHGLPVKLAVLAASGLVWLVLMRLTKGTSAVRRAAG